MVIVLLVVTTITFFVSRLLPGDPTSLWVGDHPTKEQLKTAKKDPETVNKIAFILLFISYLGLIELISLQYLF